MTTNISSLTNNIKIISNNMQNFSSVSLGIWIEVGSRNEIEDEHGKTHLLQHKAYKGTKSRSTKQIE